MLIRVLLGMYFDGICNQPDTFFQIGSGHIVTYAYSKLTFNLEEVIGRQNWFIPCDPLTYPRFFFFQKVTVLLERKSIKKNQM